MEEKIKMNVNVWLILKGIDNISKDDIPDYITELEREVFKGFVLE